MVPIHRIPRRNFLEIFYKVLNANTKFFSNTIIGEAFMSLCWEVAPKILEQIPLTNQWQHTWEAKRGTDTYAIGTSRKYKTIDNIVAQEFAQLRIEIGLLTNKFITMNSEKMNIMRAQGKNPRSYDFDVDEKAKYLDKELDNLQAKGQWSNQDTWNSR